MEKRNAGLPAALVKRVTEWSKREGTFLEHDSIRVLVEDECGIVPELSAPSGNGWINAHWQAWFRSNSGRKFSPKDHSSVWGDRITYNLSGNFPCFPGFGIAQIVDGVSIPAHGWTANSKWFFKSSGVERESGAAWVVSVMKSPEKTMPLSFKKTDLVIPGHPVHYAGVTVKNSGAKDISINAGFHNTVGAPFLQAGCVYSGAAERWATSPKGIGFESSARLKLETEFKSLKRAPLKDRGTADISVVSPPIGYTDFVMGAIPASCGLGWSALVNPAIKYAYICFFPGQGAASDGDIVLRFNALWMQYGGRPPAPWAAFDGGTDLTYCLGTENVISAIGGGLETSRRIGEALGAPTTVTIPAKGEKTLWYGTLFAPYSGCALDGGIKSITPGKDRILAEGAVSAKGKNTVSFKADASFEALKRNH
ncbi:MAG: hypothetical protein LBT16_10655 [Treponema sp.]|jgi:hypothetical protein|nr:hypothetical protein [Treponema sp.]